MSKSWESLKAALIAKGDVRGFKSEFARQLGVPPQSVQRYFNPDDTTVPSMDQADKIAAALGLHLEVSKIPPSAPQPQEPGPKLLDPDASRLALLGAIVTRLSTFNEVQLRLIEPAIAVAVELGDLGHETEAKHLKKNQA